MKTRSQTQGQKKRVPPRCEAEPCLYCGQSTLCRDYIINPGAEHELPSCSAACFEKAGRFVDYDTRHRMPFYLVLLIMVVANLFLFGFKTKSRWEYLPMLGMSIATAVCPLVFSRYELYQKFGIRKTKAIIRVVAAALAAFALLLIISN
jgi:hypothetical protein